ncbi:MAG: DUF4129 domain-containing protein [Myxococcaceae bacterium]|nr:DUF4129 domain-containing protein [Myxococcaceae bacterium]
MAVDAIELRPRGPVLLFDAAIRLCARSTGVWSLMLWPGAFLTFAAFGLVEAINRREPLAQPAMLFTAAWLFRGLCMGAACHYLEAQLMQNAEPAPWRSFVAALKHAPSLLITTWAVATLNLVLWVFTLGLGFFFIGSHAVAYAVAMRSQGHPLNLLGNAARLLGPARHTAAWVRLCGISQIIVIANVHAATSMIIKGGQKLLGFDLSYADRFCSLDNATWVATCVAVGFSLFEPLRAASATLLLVDGRVRQEGLDLLAQLEQLPKRRRSKPIAAAGVALFVAALFGATPAAQAQTDAGTLLTHDWNGIYHAGVEPALASGETPSSQLEQRLRRVVESCELQDSLDDFDLSSVSQIGERQRASLSRFVADIERLAYDEDDCEGAQTELARGLKWVSETRRAHRDDTDTMGAADRVKGILARPEFVPSAPERTRVEKPEAPRSGFAKWWNELWESFWRWLSRDRTPPPKPNEAVNSAGAGLGGVGTAVLVGSVILLVALVAFMVFNRAPAQTAPTVPGDERRILETKLESDPMSALARAPEGWSDLADQLASQGRFRDAIRHLYLALLSRLHRDGAIDYDPAKSNWDYFRAFKGVPQALPPFKELTRRFDFAWYGNMEVTGFAYQTFRGLSKTLLAPPSDRPGGLHGA